MKLIYYLFMQKRREQRCSFLLVVATATNRSASAPAPFTVPNPVTAPCYFSFYCSFYYSCSCYFC